METVVEVGSPRLLNASSRMTSATMTAKNTTMISEKENICGWKMPERATSIMPEENVAPSRTPRLATHIVVRKLAMRQPRAELRKLEASLLTPTKRSMTAMTARNASITI